MTGEIVKALSECVVGQFGIQDRGVDIRSYWDRGRPRPHGCATQTVFYQMPSAQQAGEGARGPIRS